MPCSTGKVGDWDTKEDSAQSHMLKKEPTKKGTKHLTRENLFIRLRGDLGKEPQRIMKTEVAALGEFEKFAVVNHAAAVIYEVHASEDFIGHVHHLGRLGNVTLLHDECLVHHVWSLTLAAEIPAIVEIPVLGGVDVFGWSYDESFAASSMRECDTVFLNSIEIGERISHDGVSVRMPLERLTMATSCPSS